MGEDNTDTSAYSGGRLVSLLLPTVTLYSTHLFNDHVPTLTPMAFVS